MATQPSNPPIPASQLETFATQTCDTIFNDTSLGYEHAKAGRWNEEIITSVLQNLISSTPPQSYKFAVTSTIIQHSPSKTSSALTEGAEDVTKRGMHCASGAYWNEEKDGMWSCKWDGGGRGFDVVVGIWWVGLV